MTSFCFDDLQGSVALFGEEIETLAGKHTEAFDEYLKALG